MDGNRLRTGGSAPLTATGKVSEHEGNGMRLVRFGEKGREKPGVMMDDGLVDLRSIFPDVPDIGEVFFRDNWLEKISGIQEQGKRMHVRIGCPVCRPSKIICLGKNYAEHAKEGGFDRPKKPLLFCKTPNTLIGPCDAIRMPRSSHRVDWEVELAVIIGKEAKRVGREEALNYVAGVCVANDVSARDAQFSDSQWFRGKSFDTFAPMGPAVVTMDEIENIQNLQLSAIVNETVMQEGNTRDMIFDVAYIIEYISEDITLIPGDIILTGTPAGVGIFRDPPVVLSPGDRIECRIEQIGSILNTVAAVDG